MSMSVTVATRFDSLPDDVLRALATFAPLSDLLTLARCSRHFRIVLQSQLNRWLDRLFGVTHVEEHWAQARLLQSMYLPKQPEQRVLDLLFGEANVRGYWRVYCFTDGQSILSLTRRNEVNTFGFAGYSRLHHIRKGQACSRSLRELALFPV
jgi:hypothetical protein